MVVLDADDQVIRPAKLWNDTESAPDAQWLIGRLAHVDGGGGEAAWAACGSVPVAAFTITKLSWLHRSEPDAWARVARVCLPHDWLTWKLTGAFVTDRGDASGTGYFSAARDEYALDLLAIVDGDVDWATRLPRVLRPTERAGTTTAFGLDAIVAPGTGDNMAAAVALALRAGRRRDLARHVGHRLHGERVADGRCDRRGRGLRRRDRPVPAARVHAQRDQGHRLDRALARRRPRASRCAGARRRARCRWCRRRSVLRRRAHAEPARCVGSDRRVANGHDPGATRAGRRGRCGVRAARRSRRADPRRGGCRRRHRARRWGAVGRVPARRRRPLRTTGGRTRVERARRRRRVRASRRDPARSRRRGTCGRVAARARFDRRARRRCRSRGRARAYAAARG